MEATVVWFHSFFFYFLKLVSDLLTILRELLQIAARTVGLCGFSVTVNILYKENIPLVMFMNYTMDIHLVRFNN